MIIIATIISNSSSSSSSSTSGTSSINRNDNITIAITRGRGSRRPRARPRLPRHKIRAQTRLARPRQTYQRKTQGPKKERKSQSKHTTKYTHTLLCKCVILETSCHWLPWAAHALTWKYYYLCTYYVPRHVSAVVCSRKKKCVLKVLYFIAASYNPSTKTASPYKTK